MHINIYHGVRCGVKKNKINEGISDKLKIIKCYYDNILRTKFRT